MYKAHVLVTYLVNLVCFYNVYMQNIRGRLLAGSVLPTFPCNWKWINGSTNLIKVIPTYKCNDFTPSLVQLELFIVIFYQNISWSKKISKRWIIKHWFRIIPFTGTRFFIGRILRSINAFLDKIKLILQVACLRK